MSKILIVDDHPVNRQFLATLLSYKGHETQEACDGSEALVMARAQHPDLILTDILMPTMDGYEFVRLLRSDRAIANTVVVFCTANYHEREAQRLAKDCGVAHVLMKPCEPNLVLRTVESALGLATETLPQPPGADFDRNHLRLLTDKISRQRTELENVDHRMAALIEINLQMAEEADPRRLLTRVCRATRTLIGARFSAVAAGAAGAATPTHFCTSGMDVATVQAIGTPSLRQGMLGGVLETRNGYRSATLSATPTADGLPPGFPEARCLLGAPITSLAQTYGWLCVGDKLGGELFSDEDERLLNILGAQVGRIYEIVTQCVMAQNETVEQKQAHGKLQEQLERLDLLNRITRAIGERLDLPSIFQVVIRSLEDSLPMDFCSICTYDPLEQVLINTSAGTRGKEIATQLSMHEHSRLPIDRNELAGCLAGELIYEPDISRISFALSRRLAATGLHSLVVAPLLVQGTLFGVLLAARRQKQGFSSGDCEFLKQLGEHVALAVNQSQLHTTLQRAYDDLHRSQQAHTQQERLKALGQMATGVAHDINNAISPIMLYAESLLEQETNLTTRARACLGTIHRSIEGVAQTVSRMREFYRPRDAQLETESVDLNAIVTQIVQLTHARWSTLPQQRGIVIDMQTRLEQDLPAIAGMAGEICDALTNLVLNAADAMPEGGTLTIRTRSTGATSNFPGGVIHLEVTDTGIGMDESTRRRCLEPFFTTKGEQGTGLGLAMVYGTVQRHGAELEIESASGAGTSLRLKFPMPTGAPAPSQRQPVRQSSRALSILIVDDDPRIIESVGDILKCDGHEVVAMDGGQAGIDTIVDYARRGDTFSVVITDLGMPKVDGRKVAEAAKTHLPAAKVILLTGWGQSIVAENNIPPHVDRVLTKPPKLNELRHTLAELMTQPNVSGRPNDELVTP